MTENVSRPSRRAVARGAAWALPTLVVAGQAPALAASRCDPVVIDWDTQAVGTSAVSTTVGSTTLSVTASPDVSYSDVNLTVRPGPQGGVSGNYVTLSKLNPVPGATATYTFTFSQPVRAVSFTIVDIDATLVSQWVDAVALSSGFVTNSRGVALTGTGTATDYFRLANNATGNLADISPDGNVTLTYAGDLTTFQLFYRNDYPTGQAPGTGTRTQGIGITDIRFTPSSC